MATIQQPQSREQLPPQVTFDDQLWPINLAIVILAVFIASRVFTTGSFDDDRVWFNARTHLEILAGVTVALMWVAGRIDRRRVRRGLLLALLMSLIAHLLFLSALRSTPWELLADRLTLPPRHFVPLEVVVQPVEGSGSPGRVDLRQGEPPTLAPAVESADLARQELSPLESLPLASHAMPPLEAEAEPSPDLLERSPAEDPALEPTAPHAQLARQAPRAIELSAPASESMPGEEPLPEAPALTPASSALARSTPRPDTPKAMPTPGIEPPNPELPSARPSISAERVTDTAPPTHRIAARAPIAPRIAVPQLDSPEEPSDIEPASPPIAAPRADSPLRPTLPSNRIAVPTVPAAIAAESPSDALSPSPSVPKSLERRETSEESLVSPSAPLLARSLPRKPLIEGRTREPADAFAKRAPLRQRQAGGDEASRRSEATIQRGLQFLARQQAADGSWRLQLAIPDANDQRPSFRSDTAATGLALLTFLGAGYDHYDGPHQRVVQRALDWLVKHQQKNGDLYQPGDASSNRSAWLYSHGIASIALCEAYGMTGDASLAGPAQRSIDFIATAQDARRGAWRYAPGVGSDTSVSGWQLMALKSGELAGLKIPPGTYQKIKHYLDSAQAPGSQFVYNPAAPDTPQQGHGRRPTASMTAVGLLMRLYTGWNRDDPRMVEGAQHLLGKLPDNGNATQPARDTYYWYYATQVMFHMRGEYWRAWSGRLNAVLIPGQVAAGPLAGSWDPLKPLPDRWGPQGGRLYVTALNLLSLEVAYRHLPIYESTAQ